MDKTGLDISNELLQDLSIEELADLKVEVDNLSYRLDNIIEKCEETLKNKIGE